WSCTSAVLVTTYSQLLALHSSSVHICVTLCTTLFPYTTLFRSWRGTSPPAGPAAPSRCGSTRTCCGPLSARGGSPPSPSRAESGDRKSTSELQSHLNLVCRLLLEKKKRTNNSKP